MANRRTGLNYSNSGGKSGSSHGRVGTLKERANMSFMLVVMFFAVFGLIVLTEIFLIDERRDGAGMGAFGGHRSGHRLLPPQDRPDYEEVVAEDYINIKGGFDAQIGLLLENNNNPTVRIPEIPADPKIMPSLPPNLEAHLPILDKNLPLTTAAWLPVTKTKYKFFVYSAYYDDRIIRSSGNTAKNSNFLMDTEKKARKSATNDSGLIRIIGATKTRAPERVWCRLWYRQEQNGENITISMTVAGKVKIIRENWNLKYSACFVICPMPKEPLGPPTAPLKIGSIPEAVSVVAKLRTMPTNRLLVQNRPEDRPSKRDNFAICVKPLHYDYNRVIQLVEFIELHRILGADHVILYNDTVGTEANCALKYYESQGLVSFLPWHHLDMISQREIRTEGLFAALNDCLYRSMYKYEYVALLDLDEFIIPRHNDTIIQLIQWISSRVNTQSSSAFSFQNAFFYLQWPDDPWISMSKSPIESNLITLRKTLRRSKLHPHKQRSKYICKPKDIVEAGNHFVWELLVGQSTLNVPADAAILHHYRVCEFGGDDCVKTPFVVDRTAYKHRKELIENIKKIWSDLDERCLLPQLETVSPITTHTYENTQKIEKS